MIEAILFLTILNSLVLIILFLFKLAERMTELRLNHLINSQPTSVKREEVVDFPPPPSPPLDDTEVVAGSAIEAESFESPLEESSDEREFLAEQKRIAQRGQA